MKKFLFILFLLFFTISCEKSESDDYRDTFCYKWVGKVYIDTPTWSTERENTIFIVNAYNQEDLMISTMGGVGQASVTNQNTYDYYIFEIGSPSNSCGVTSSVEYRGSGVVKGDSLFESGTVIIGQNGVITKGNWKSASKKIL